MFRGAASLLRANGLTSTNLQHRRCLSITAHTLFSPTVELLERHLTNKSKTSVTAYLFSSIDAADISTLLAPLQASGSSIGSFSTSLPQQEPSLSVITIENAVTFRTDLTGRPGAQVGRYQRPDYEVTADDLKGSRIGEGDAIKSKEGWAGMWKSEKVSSSIPELEGVSAQSFFLLTDGLPRPLVQSLDAMFPQSSRLGLLTSPTPFLTGRPHTLLHDRSVHSSGAVGIAIKDTIETAVDLNLQDLSEPYIIAEAQGNLLLRFKESNSPIQTLMDALHHRFGPTLGNKDEEIYLKIGDRAIKVLGGSPSRVALSLDTEEPLVAGTSVQFMCSRPASTHTPKPDTLAVSYLRPSDSAETLPPKGQPRIMPAAHVASESGFILDDFICTVPNAVAVWGH